MTHSTSVLIVGAGPSGLMMAAALHHHGIDFRIIEKRSEPTPTSNAAAIHPRTMEMLDDLGMTLPFLKQGQRIDYLSLNHGKFNIATVSTSAIESYYNFILSIPQNITEEILNHHLKTIKHDVERNRSLHAIQKSNGKLLAEIVDENHETEEIECHHLIACDGAHSTTRDLLNMRFGGTDIKQQFVLADAKIPDTYPDNQFTIYFHEDGPLAVFPFQKGKARVLATMIDPNHDPKQPVSLLEIQDITQKRSDGLLEVISSNWMSSFWIHSKMLNRFRDGNVFFVGDAAHIHSPVGGQGMNTGMQDAYNLAWKLALSLKGHVKPNLLDSYEEERQPNAEALLANTERMTTMILLRNPVLQWLRRKLMRFALKHKRIQHTVAMELSMLNMHYEKSSVINYEFHVSSRSPLPGHRAPDVFFQNREETQRMDDLLRTTKHALVIFTGKNPSSTSIQQIHSLLDWANERSNLIKPIVIIHPSASDEFTHDMPFDTNMDLHRVYHANKSCFFVVRPDNYIGCCSSELDMELLLKYWIHIFSSDKNA